MHKIRHTHTNNTSIPMNAENGRMVMSTPFGNRAEAGKYQDNRYTRIKYIEILQKHRQTIALHRLKFHASVAYGLFLSPYLQCYMLNLHFALGIQLLDSAWLLN